jgi:hypothetical protein
MLNIAARPLAARNRMPATCHPPKRTKNDPRKNAHSDTSPFDRKQGPPIYLNLYCGNVTLYVRKMEYVSDNQPFIFIYLIFSFCKTAPLTRALFCIYCPHAM